MLISTMSDIEATKEIHKDWEKSHRSSLRLSYEYDKERRKRKISKTACYNKVYTIKSARKNNWIFMFEKAPSEDRYKGVDSIKICHLVYYYTTIGLRVFEMVPGGGLAVFNSHLFTRYNERMKLNITAPLEIVKRFFTENGYYTAKIIERDDRDFTLAVCREGLLLGEIRHDTHWILHKTFLSRDIIGYNQQLAERQLLKSLESEILEELNSSTFNATAYHGKRDLMSSIINKRDNQ